MLCRGDIVAGYTVERILGRGGSSTVYLVQADSDGPPLALKVLEDGGAALEERLRRAARRQSALTHRNLVPLLDCLDVGGRPALLMPAVAGPSLAVLLAVRPLGPAEAATIGREVATGLAALHDAGIVHRDLTPDNVVLDRDDAGDVVPRITDFGIARQIGDESMPLTHDGGYVGTQRYSAPEQLDDARGADGRADLWALGCLLIEVLCGRPAFPPSDGDDVIAAIRAGRYRDPTATLADLPEAGHWRRLLADLLQPDRERRPATAREVAARFAALVPQDAVDALAGDGSIATLITRCSTEATLPAATTSDDAGEPVAPTTAGEAAVAADDTHGASEAFGPYRPVRLLGAGGMGTVYEALQASPHRTVALKLLRPGLPGRSRRRRFEREAEILARLKHPGIAQVYAAGVADRDGEEVPYFAMELVDGRPLTDFARDHELDRAARLQLLAAVCDAVEHAHSRGVVHRDLKPSNILVEASGTPKVLDFGIARLTDSDLQATTIETRAGDVLGTVRYMSPEQAAGRASEVDARTDVYALGVLGYELLSGRLPYRVDGVPLAQALRAILEDDPSGLGQLDRTLRGDLDSIITTALAKDPARRYPTAAALASDIRRHLDHLPVVARPPGPGYRLWKFARRNRALAAGVILSFVALAAGTAVSTYFAIVAGRERQLAESSAAKAHRAEDEALRLAYRANLAAAQGALRNGDAGLAREFLQSAPEPHRAWEWEHLWAATEGSLRRLPLTENADELAFRRDERTLLVASGDEDGPRLGRRMLRWIDLESGRVTRTVTVYPDRPVRAGRRRPRRRSTIHGVCARRARGRGRRSGIRGRHREPDAVRPCRLLGHGPGGVRRWPLRIPVRPRSRVPGV